jgi:hypothetical protein
MIPSIDKHQHFPKYDCQQKIVFLSHVKIVKNENNSDQCFIESNQVKHDWLSVYVRMYFNQKLTQ